MKFLKNLLEIPKKIFSKIMGIYFLIIFYKISFKMVEKIGKKLFVKKNYFLMNFLKMQKKIFTKSSCVLNIFNYFLLLKLIRLQIEKKIFTKKKLIFFNFNEFSKRNCLILISNIFSTKFIFKNL